LEVMYLLFFIIFICLGVVQGISDYQFWTSQTFHPVKFKVSKPIISLVN
jgi:hypothetical protein